MEVLYTKLVINSRKTQPLTVKTTVTVTCFGSHFHSQPQVAADGLTQGRERALWRKKKMLFFNYNQQDASIFDYFQKALHVSGGTSAHHQEHIAVHSASGIVNQYYCRLVSSTIPSCSSTG